MDSSEKTYQNPHSIKEVRKRFKEIIAKTETTKISSRIITGNLNYILKLPYELYYNL